MMALEGIRDRLRHLGINPFLSSDANGEAFSEAAEALELYLEETDAAPDMLNACRAALAWMEGFFSEENNVGDWSRLRDELRAAIAKVEGRS